ncbi:4'-phosphopantetheinyl transferase superfamily protein [bacterium]|nr:4'-phosphopantetheinyl transferase superfamily protein [bacterium]
MENQGSLPVSKPGLASRLPTSGVFGRSGASRVSSAARSQPTITTTSPTIRRRGDRSRPMPVIMLIVLPARWRCGARRRSRGGGGGHWTGLTMACRSNARQGSTAARFRCDPPPLTLRPPSASIPPRGASVADSPPRDPHCDRGPDPLLGLGADLCAVARIANELGRDESDILTAVFRPDELARALGRPHPARTLAAGFAAKEAVIKALAPAGGQGTFWQDIEISEPGDGPAATLHGRLARLADRAGVVRLVLSSARCRDYATACAVAMGRPPAGRDPSAAPDPPPNAPGPRGPLTGGRTHRDP